MVNEQKNDTWSAARHDTIRKKNINLSTNGMHVIMLTVLFTRLLCLLLQAIHRSAEGRECRDICSGGVTGYDWGEIQRAGLETIGRH